MKAYFAALFLGLLSFTGFADSNFGFPVPKSDHVIAEKTLWATEYHVHQAAHKSAGYPLLDKGGDTLGVNLTYKDWCASSLEGTVNVKHQDGRFTTFNVEPLAAEQLQVDCAPLYPSLPERSKYKMSRTRFKQAVGPYGDGYDGHILVPFRTIAVDISISPLRQVYYIPAARGTTVVLPNGQKKIHDGYFFAADKGSAIKGPHIDVFIATSKTNPFAFVKGPTGTFKAYVVDNPEIYEALLKEHLPQDGELLPQQDKE